jgi:D-glycero-D-manno-heptose 1,7-bisphosphate phosphatase
MGKPLILLDRDGVLNRMVVDAEHGTIDSPLHPRQVELIDGVPEALAQLSAAGFTLAVVSNQPAAAKNKTTRANLEAVHEAVLAAACRLGGRIASSHLCFYRSEDGCSCRKPKPGLLREALALHGGDGAWMVGDGITDIQAGAALGLRTGFLGPRKCDACKLFGERGLSPTWWGADLRAFADHVLNQEVRLGSPDLPAVGAASRAALDAVPLGSRDLPTEGEHSCL